MDPTQIDAVVQRLVVNPHDQDALTYAHSQGAADPKSYALLLERVGAETRDPAYASHWLSEAANVWSTTLGDAHRAARVLMQAIDRDPTQRTASDRLAQLYRDKGDIKALVALLERRAKALAPLAAQSKEIRAELAAMHEELGRLWGDSLQQPRKALENFRRSIELEPSSVQALRGAREIYKSLGQWDDAFQLYETEAGVEKEPQRKLELFREEVAARRSRGDLAGATRALTRARQVDDADPALQQEYGALVVERLQAGEEVAAAERAMGAELLVSLAEAYDGEHGLAYSAGALDIQPGHDRALQLYAHYAQALAKQDDLASRYLAYVEASPAGAMAADARWLLAGSYEGAGQIDNAIGMLEPLRAQGDEEAIAKLRSLYAAAGRPMPSAPPALAPAARTASATAAAAMPTAPAPRPRPAAPVDAVQSALDTAQALVTQGKRAEAYERYKEVLASDPAHPEALSWAEEYLRSKRDYGALSDVLLAAVRAPGAPLEARRERLREVAGVCEGNLRDADGAIQARKQLRSIDRGDETARSSLTRLLERAQRWDDLANLLEQEATAETDLEKKIALEKKLAALHEQKRHDPAGAAEAWGRIANLTPEDDGAVDMAATLYEKAGQIDRAALVIGESVASIDDVETRGALLRRLGELREKLRDPSGAAEAYASAAEVLDNAELWDAAERCRVSTQAWDRAGEAALKRADLTDEPKSKAHVYARAAAHFARVNDDVQALSALQHAAELDPRNDDYARQLADRYTAAERWADLVALLERRGDVLVDASARVAARKQAATLYATKIEDKEAARLVWLKVLEDGEDREALERLVDDAIERQDPGGATALLRRLGAATPDKAERTRVALREAELLAEGVGDVDLAVALYERILRELDPLCRAALQAIADLQEARDNLVAATDALKRELQLVEEPSEAAQIAGRLARLYEQLGNVKNAIASLEIVRKADPDDFDALTHLCELCEKDEDWDKLAELLAQRIEVEGDDAEAAALTRKLSSVLSDKLDRGDEALAALTELADAGRPEMREAYVVLGDRLGWRGIVATKLVEWWLEAKPSAERLTSLRGAFDRFAEVGRDEDAIRIGCEIVRSRGGDAVLAVRLEELSVKARDLDALAVAHDVMVRELTGAPRAKELVRQAEERVKAGSPRPEALQHGEAALTSVPPADAEELLERLAVIAETPDEVVDLYERQVSRCKAPADRVAALARAAQVAAGKGRVDRAAQFFELAVSGTPTDETLDGLERAARDGDAAHGGEALQRALVAAMAAGGQGRATAARRAGRSCGGPRRWRTSIWATPTTRSCSSATRSSRTSIR